MPLTTKQIKRVLKWLRPSVQARLRKEFPELPERARSYRLTYEDLLLIDELNGKSDAPPPKPEPVVPKVEEPKRVLTDDEIGEACVAIILDLYAKLPTAQVIPFKPKKKPSCPK